MACPRCSADNPTGSRFCGRCGAALAGSCPRCLQPTLPDQGYCVGCGLELGRAGAKTTSNDEGERRHATVVFSDLVGFTSLSERRDPEEVEALMTRIKAEASAVIERHGGTVNQFVGDEIMALFGVPLAGRDDPCRAVAASLALHDAVRSLGADLASDGTSLELHTGISTGLVVVRRSDARAGEYAVTGDTVNIAARLRSLAEAGAIMVSADTWHEVADAFEGEPGEPVALRGKEHAVVPHRIVAARRDRAASARLLIGRDDELRQLQAFAAACTQRRRGRVVVVRGDPGVGKTRLVAEFGSEAVRLGLACHAAAVLDFGAETGRDALRSIARSLIGLSADADEARRAEQARRVADERTLAPAQQLFLHDLVDAVPTPPLRALADAMNTTAREQGSMQMLVELVRHAAATRPPLLLVEDIHWADAWTLERLSALALLASHEPFLLVLTTRFAGDPSTGTWRTTVHGAPVVALDLAPLPVDEAEQLAAAASAISAETRRSCVERAEGNPLFLLQLLLAASDDTRSALPGSIQALVHARMDRLAGADKAALQAAAVLGQRHTLETLRHLLDDPAYDNRPLVEQFLVRPDGEAYLFCHALIRDGAYASLLRARGRKLHARAAEWFRDRDPALAAEHYERAEHPDAAAAYLTASAVLAAQLRYPHALALAQRGLEIAPTRELRYALLQARGRLLTETGRAAEAIDATRAALDVAGDDAERAAALIAMAAAMRLHDRIDEGLAALAEAEPLADRSGSSLDLSRLHHLRGNLLFPLGRAAECLAAHERALQHARAAGSLEAEAAALGGLGDAQYLRGRMRSAHAQFRDCVAIARQRGLGRLEVANLPMVGWTVYHLADLAGAIAIGHEAAALAARAAQPRAEMLARSLVTWLEGLLRDRVDEAERAARETQRLIDQLGARRFEAQLKCILATLAWRRGDRERARADAALAVAICREHGMGHIGPMALGVAALVDPDPEQRRRLLQEGEAQLARGAVSHNHFALREFAIEVAHDLGDWDAMDVAAGRIRAYAEADPLPVSDLIADRGNALARHGRGERSPALLEVLSRLRATAAGAEFNTLLPLIDAALADFDVVA